MDDVLLVAVFFAAATSVGLPFALLFPAGRFEARILAAPPLGFGVIAVCSTVLYKFGIAPQTSLMMLSAAGVLFGVVAVAAARYPLRQMFSARNGFVVLGAVSVIFICLLPAWTGGNQFSLYQG